MLVEFKVKAGQIDSDNFLQWRNENVEGYFLILNTARIGQIHSSSCESYNKENLLENTFDKIACSTNSEELVEWGKLKKRNIYRCNKCIHNELDMLKNKDPIFISKWPFDVPINTSSENNEQPPAGNYVPKPTYISTLQYQRDPLLKSWILKQAEGICECCDSPSPFVGVDGLHYLEVHHVKHLANNGTDRASNTVALCPNCHREIHLGINAQALRDRLYERISRLIPE